MNENLFSAERDSAPVKDIPFNIPLVADLDDNGGVVELTTFYEAGRFASAELKAWIELFGKEKADKDFLQTVIDFQLRTPRSICAAAESVLNGEMSPTEGFSVIRSELNNYLGFKCIHSDGTIGKMAAVMYRYEPMLMGIVAGASGSVPLSDAEAYPSHADAESFTFGYALTMHCRTNIRPEMLDGKVGDTLRKINHIIRRVELADKQIKPIANEQIALQQNIEEAHRQLKTYRTDVAEYISQLVAEIKQTSDSAINEMWNQLNLIQNDHERQLAALRQSVSSRIRYGTALDYWNAQQSLNQAKANQMTGWYVISGLFSITFLGLIGILTKKYLAGVSAFVPFITLFLPLMVAGGLFWLLLQTRTRYEKAAAQAQEKVALLETLAALETEGKAKESDRDGVLESIFKTTFTAPSPAMEAAEHEDSAES